MTEKETRILILLAAVFAGVLSLGVGVGSKVISIFGLTASASAITYPVTFLVTDTVAEVWGKRRARQIVLSGFIAILIVAVFVAIAIYMPSADFWKQQEAFVSIFGVSIRLIIGGLTAYLVSQLHDVWMFHLLKNLTDGKHLWLRNNVSTIISQFIDTVIFVTIGFAGVQPLLPLIVGQYIIKVGMAAIDTPLVYLLVNIVRRSLPEEAKKTKLP